MFSSDFPVFLMYEVWALGGFRCFAIALFGKFDDFCFFCVIGVLCWILVALRRVGLFDDGLSFWGGLIFMKVFVWIVLAGVVFVCFAVVLLP